jgi:nucleoid DNA-binding protein
VIKMNKTQFARTLAEVNKVSYKEGAKIVDMFLKHLETVIPTLAHGEALNLTGYVKFTAKDVPAHEARNPQNGEPVQVDATRQVRASVGATLKQAIKA